MKGTCENIEYYTSYFANPDLKKDSRALLVSIAGKPPKGYDGAQYKKLAPSWDIWSQWHDSEDPDKNDRYTKRFKSEILAKLDPNEVNEDLLELFKLYYDKENRNYNKIILLCYESPDNFCHRHLVANWLRDAGFDISEYPKN